MKILTTLLITLFIAPNVHSQSESFSIEHIYPINRGHSFVHFVAKYMGYAEVRGSFARFAGAIYYDPDHPEETSVSLEIEVNSLDSDNDRRDRDLTSEHWFEAETYPKISFMSTSTILVGERLHVTGDLTIKATTRTTTLDLNPVIGPVQDIRSDDQVIFTGSHTIDRTDYGVQGERWSRIKEGIAGVADEVRIEFSILGRQINERNYSNFIGDETRPQGRLLAAFQSDGLAGLTAAFEEMKATGNIAPQALNMVGNMLILKKQPENALNVLLINEEQFPDDATVHDALGTAYAHLGDWSRAKTQYGKSLALQPDNLLTREILRHLPD